MPSLNQGKNRHLESDSNFHRASCKEMEDAKEVHRAFFPQEDFSIPGLDCEIFYRPARCIGGDYYDFLPLPDRWGIAIGDVCGKGISAALLMASLQASLRAQTMHAHSDLSTLIVDVHRWILAASPKHLYASLFYAEYDATTSQLQYVNAGHNSPMVLRWENDECEVFHLEPTGIALGLLESSQFSSKAFQLERGDLFVAYTDGITESENPFGESWGQQRLDILLRDCHGFSPAQIVGRVLDEISVFRSNRPQLDDMTLMAARVR